MAETQSPQPCTSTELAKSVKPRRTSLLLTASAKKALAKVTPSSKTVQSLLASATSMHPEILPDRVPAASSVRSPLIRTNVAGQQRLISESWGAKLISPLPLTVEYVNSNTVKIHKTMMQSLQSQSTTSLRRRTFPSTTEEVDSRNQSSHDLPPTESSQSLQRATDSDQDALTTGNTTSGDFGLLGPYAGVPVHIHGSRMIHRRDIGSMIELHMLAWGDDRLTRRLQESQVPSAEIQIMMKMLCERTTSTLDNVLVSRLNKSQDPADIVGWLSCSIVRYKTASRQTTMENELRGLSWNLATAAALNKNHNAGSTTCLMGDASMLKERNYLVGVLCKGTRWSQKQAFRYQDFIVITNLVLDPTYPDSGIIAKRLVLEATYQASLLKMPVYVCSSGDYCTQLYRDECGFTQLGEHASLMFDPAYILNYFVFRPKPRRPHSISEDRGSNRLDSGRNAVTWPDLDDAA